MLAKDFVKRSQFIVVASKAYKPAAGKRTAPGSHRSACCAQLSARKAANFVQLESVFRERPIGQLLRSDTTPSDAIVVEANYADNLLFPNVLRDEMESGAIPNATITYG